MTFKTIETQEQLDAVIKDRIDRATEKARKEAEEKYADYDDLKKIVEEGKTADNQKQSEIDKLKAELESQTKTVSDLKGQVSGLENEKAKLEIAQQVGLPLEMANRLHGDNREALMQDAEGLKTLMGTKHAPLAGYEEPTEKDNRRSELKSMLKGMQG